MKGFLFHEIAERGSDVRTVDQERARAVGEQMPHQGSLLVTTGLTDTYSTPIPPWTAAGGRLPTGHPISHTFPWTTRRRRTTSSPKAPGPAR